MSKIKIISAFLIVLISIFLYSANHANKFKLLSNRTSQTAKDHAIKKPSLKNQIHLAKTYCKKNHFDTQFAIFINYAIHSGLKRGYLVDLQKKLAFDSFLVSHGCGQNNWGSDESKDNPTFSNEFESHCSSLGKFKIGTRSRSDWGINIKYSLHGLEKSNNNALKRFIVMHGWKDVPNYEIYPNGTPEGWGCPAVSNQTMTSVDSILSKRKQVLLWSFR
jgi:hypothetical protein